jgi:GntR family transcriptional regulator/MocR family aminotransferase
MIDLAFVPDRASPIPVYRQLGDALRALIDRGRLAAGVKLPATRELSVALGLHRNTVSRTYQDLVGEGYLTAHVGQGTFVARRPPQGVPRPASHDAGEVDAFVWPGLFARRVRDLAVPPSLRRVAAAARKVPMRYSFRGGQIAADALPERDLRRAFDRVVSYRLPELANLHEPRGYAPLRRAIAQHLVTRGIACGAEEVLVVNGSQQALDLLARVLLDPGDTVAVEEPGYFGATLAFSAAGANLVGVPVDAQGLRTDRLERVLQARRVKLVCATPSAHCPTSATMREPRRRALLALSDEHQAPIVEDDYDSELRYEGAPIPALKGQDPAGRVIYVGTFSKIVFPSLRIGYMVAAPALLEKLVLARWVADAQPPVVPQAALAELLASGALDRHVRRMRKLYAERRDAMLAALEASMPVGAAWSRPAGGHLVWVTLPPGTDPDGLLEAALAAGVEYTPGEAFHLDGRGREHLALCFTNLTREAIGEGVARLGEILRSQLARPRRRSER